VNSKTILLSSSNGLLYLTLCLLAGSGLLLELRMDSEDDRPRIMGMNADEWGEIHFLCGIGLVVVSLLHMILNWAWIRGTLAKTKLGYLVIATGIIFIAVLFLWPADVSWFSKIID
jgi:hypothetical protein